MKIWVLTLALFPSFSPLSPSICLCSSSKVKTDSKIFQVLFIQIRSKVVGLSEVDIKNEASFEVRFDSKVFVRIPHLLSSLSSLSLSPFPNFEVRADSRILLCLVPRVRGIDEVKQISLEIRLESKFFQVPSLFLTFFPLSSSSLEFSRQIPEFFPYLCLLPLTLSIFLKFCQVPRSVRIPVFFYVPLL